ncbi:hypothetical protein BGZ80_008687 [Entomortierella chlamydospora]|uniref:Phospholipid-transporting ATPase n=1 Tax=Entomortierella chlamydospora TaxID=101097 RepID=A0A9P6N3U8_9FUNG|nr:hypothetical protein BGZ80_008687 [Entomortierella chlamydospora]
MTLPENPPPPSPERPHQSDQLPIGSAASASSSTPLVTSTSSTSLNKSLSPTSTSQLRTRPRSGSLPMGHSYQRTQGASSSLRLEVLPDDRSGLSSTSSSTPFHNAPRGGSSTVSTPSKLRHVTSTSGFGSSSSSSGRSRSGSITSPRPANLSLLAPTSPSISPIGASSPLSSSSGSTVIGQRPRSGSSSPLPNNLPERRRSLREDETDAGLVKAQLNLSLDKGPPQSIETWDPVIPDILVQDEDPDEPNSTTSMSEHHDEEEEKIVSQYQVLNLIIPDISEAVAAAEQQEQLESELASDAAQPTTSQSTTSPTLSGQPISNSRLNPPTSSVPSTRPGSPLLPLSNSSSISNLNLAAAGGSIQSGSISPVPPATLSARFRLPFSSKAFVPPSRPASVHQPSQPPAETPFAGSSTVLGINNPMQSSANGSSAIRSSIFDYRLTNLLFGGSSIAPSVRSFDPTRASIDGEENRRELYEVEFNVPPDPTQEEARRLDRTTWGRIRKVFRAGFPGRDLDPRTRKPRYKYPTNNIKTTKYTLVTFLPVNLLFQILPLTLVLTITAIKDALEDYRRYQQDKRSNSLECTLIKDGELIPIKSKDIRPGDVLKISKNDKIPADVVLLSSSMDEGACFVETSELDGETNLKRKAALTITSGLTRLEQISRLTGKITTEMPNERLSRLDGRIKLRYDGTDFNVETLDDEKSGGEFTNILRGTSSSSLISSGPSISFSRGQKNTAGGPKLDEVVPVTMTNVALRGCWLKNTEWVYGVVLYAGVDTKMMRNLKNTGLKFSTMETKLNRMIVAIFVFNAALLIASMCFAYLMNFYVVYTFVIPISVFISVELCRVVQALWMIWDEEMRSYTEGPLSQAELEEIAMEQGDAAAADAAAETDALPTPKKREDDLESNVMSSAINDTKPKSKKFWKKTNFGFLKRKKKAPKNWTRMHVRNSNLNEDLGAVEHIFSDKTGTLTRNVMKLSKWHIGGRTFHELQQPGSLGLRMRDPSISDEEYDLLMAFCRNIVVCHSVIPCEDSNTGELLYEAQSPDESALLEALRDNGVVLKAKTKDSVTVEIFGLITETYKVLKVLEFTSDRKCMSVIIDTPQGIQLFCKGADNVILARADTGENDPLLMRQLDGTVRRFSIAGLRTLMLAWRPLSPEEYRRFDETYSKAECHIGDGEDGSEDREDMIRSACETIEGRLRLLGCTAIEDRLQDQVPETIEYLMDADIKIWLLTGDKQETAINIGISSRLISPAMKILVLNVKVERDCRLVLEYFVEKMKERERDEERYLQEYQQSSKPGIELPEKDRYALVVNGESLAFVLGNEIFEDMFLRIGTSCHSVICCRVTPLQKALVVKLVRKKLHKVTLAIGDGANDISMIQAAHVGVGIEGMEGAQAARSSDFSFKQFKNLKRLLTIHGRYSYLRMSKIIFFSFYKSICLITVQFWFGFMNAWSGGALYDENFLTLWNMVFTALLPITTACFEKDVEEESIGRYPKLYKAAKDGIFWNTLTVAGWGIASFWHSGALFGAIYGSVLHGVVGGDSAVMDESMLSFYAGSLVLITVTLKMLLMISHYTLPIFLALGISMAGYMIVFIGLEVVGLLEEGVFAGLHRLPFYYLGLILIPIACLLPDYTLAYFRRQYTPSDAQIIQEEQRLIKLKKLVSSAGHNKNGKKARNDLEDQEAMVELDSPIKRTEKEDDEDEDEDGDEEGSYEGRQEDGGSKSQGLMASNEKE